MDTTITNAQSFMADYLTGLSAVLQSLPPHDVETALAYLWEAYDQGRRVFVVGNGGSAATASHLGCDLGKTILGQGAIASAKRFKVIPLTDNVPLLTAWANDVSYDTVFAEQLCNLAAPGDLLIVITASGNSPNILAAVKAARALRVKSIGLLGFQGGLVRDMLDHAVVVRSTNYGHIEDTHLILTHLITAYFKERYAGARFPMEAVG